MSNRIVPFAVGLVIATVLTPALGVAGVVVLVNRTKDRVSCTTIQPDEQEVQHLLKPNDVAAVLTNGSVTVAYRDGEQPRRYTVQANGIYVFHSDGRKLQLMQQPIAGMPKLAANKSAQRLKGPCVIPVKLLVDDKEPRVQATWEKQYRDRLAAASAIIEKACGVRFEAVAVERWSSNHARDFLQLMNEFDRKVRPEPARLALGFTGQFEALREDTRMGGARGPFRPHILLREWGRQITEPERLEMLVHELGHYLGAVHSAEPHSVMRPDLSNRQARVRGYRIRFDALNTLAMCLVCEEFRTGRPTHLSRVPAETKNQLRPIYQALYKSLPDDPAAPLYLAMVQSPSGLAGAGVDHRREVIQGASRVVQAVSDAAKQLDPLTRQDGDRLTERYVRAAAAEAAKLPRSSADEAFLLGLGVALSDASTLPGPPILGQLWQQIDPPSQRAARPAAFGSPTMRSRRDSLEHFAMSAALTSLFGATVAEKAGMMKEVNDAQVGSGLSFIDLSSDLAGVAFAQAVLDGRLPLSRIETAFSVTDFLPATDGLREGITWPEFVAAYGNPSDARWIRQRQAILTKIRSLPGYKAAAHAP